MLPTVIDRQRADAGIAKHGLQPRHFLLEFLMNRLIQRWHIYFSFVSPATRLRRMRVAASSRTCVAASMTTP